MAYEPPNGLRQPRVEFAGVHFVMMAGDHSPPKNNLLPGQRTMKGGNFP
jgi:hypothetical protein